MYALVFVLFIVASAIANPTADFEKFKKWYGVLTLRECTSANFDQLFDEQKEEIHSSKGLVVELSCADADSELTKILGRLTEIPLEADWTHVNPTGEWQYDKPLVLIVNEKIKDSLLIQMFITQRPFSELEPSGKLKKAKSRLKKLVHKKELIEYERMNRLFDSKPNGKRISPIAPPVTPTPK